MEKRRKQDVYEKRIKEFLNHVPLQINKIAVQKYFFSQKISDDEFWEKLTASSMGCEREDDENPSSQERTEVLF